MLFRSRAKHGAAKRPLGAALKAGLLFGRALRPLGLFAPALQRSLDKLPLSPATDQESIDMLQALTQQLVVDVADDGGEAGPEVLGERKDLAGHDASLTASP